MQDHIHNLVQQLSEKQDSVWRYEKHYIPDAEKVGDSSCVEMYKKLWDEDKKDVDMLKDEIKKHVEDGTF